MPTISANLDDITLERMREEMKAQGIEKVSRFLKMCVDNYLEDIITVSEPGVVEIAKEEKDSKKDDLIKELNRHVDDLRESNRYLQAQNSELLRQHGVLLTTLEGKKEKEEGKELLAHAQRRYKLKLKWPFRWNHLRFRTKK